MEPAGLCTGCACVQICVHEPLRFVVAVPSGRRRRQVALGARLVHAGIPSPHLASICVPLTLPPCGGRMRVRTAIAANALCLPRPVPLRLGACVQRSLAMNPSHAIGPIGDVARSLMHTLTASVWVCVPTLERVRVLRLRAGREGRYALRSAADTPPRPLVSTSFGRVLAAPCPRQGVSPGRVGICVDAPWRTRSAHTHVLVLRCRTSAIRVPGGDIRGCRWP